MNHRISRIGALLAALLGTALLSPSAARAGHFDGVFFRGDGDVEYLQLLDIARRMLDADPEWQSLGMLYTPAWNGFVEGPTWDMWWIQNSYGPTYCGLPLLQEPLVTFLQNAQDLWFNQMGDGKRAPDGSLCDCAAPGRIFYKQGDGMVGLHDWGMEFTAAGLVMQAELLLIGRDARAIDRYLPLLERAAHFIETRRDPKNNLFLAGAAGNLLAPSYAGWKRPNGRYDKAYLAGLSVTYIAALDRLIELEKMAGHPDKVKLYGKHRDLARKGLPLLTTPQGYFIKSLDPDGTRHGVYGAAKHGYFDAVVNHDAICFRVVDDAQAAKIYAQMAAIPGLRPHKLIITNYPSLDDMYTRPAGLWGFGTWVNGGHWSTCEARMIMAYYQRGKYDDARRSMQQIVKFARAFRLDNPLVKFGSAPYQPGQPINLTYDAFGPPAAMVRGLFEYLYRADGLTLLPHIPSAITRLEQHFPVRFGSKRLYLATAGSGSIRAVMINGKPWKKFEARSVFLPYDDRMPAEAVIQIVLGDAKPTPFTPRRPAPRPASFATAIPSEELAPPSIAVNRLPLRIGADSNGGSRFLGDIARVRVFNRALKAAEIAALATAAGKASDLDRDRALVGHWTFAAAKDGTFPNAAGARLPARIVGKVQVVDSPSGKAVRLSGQGYLEVAADAHLDPTRACTLEAWIRPDKLHASGGRILDKCTVGKADGYLLDTYPGNSLRLIVQRDEVRVPARLRPDRWVHVAATVAPNGTFTLYVDGKRAGTRKASGENYAGLQKRLARLAKFRDRLAAAGLADCYEAGHAQLAVDYWTAFLDRRKRLADGRLKPLPGPSNAAANKLYLDTVSRLCSGLERRLNTYANSRDAHGKRVHAVWQAVK